MADSRRGPWACALCYTLEGGPFANGRTCSASETGAEIVGDTGAPRNTNTGTHVSSGVTCTATGADAQQPPGHEH